jgi:hypothetical protein
MKPNITIMEVAGVDSALMGMRLPTKSTGSLEQDIRLAKSLIIKGDTHGKFQRGITVWLSINMPRFMWSELDTYVVGVSPTSSESTMYTLLKETRDERDGFYDRFVDGTDPTVMDFFYDLCVSVNNDLSIGLIKRDQAVWRLKSALPEGWMQKRIRSYSYQTLKRIYQQRKNHRLPEWQVFCDAIEKLPHSEDLIFGMSFKEFNDKEVE